MKQFQFQNRGRRNQEVMLVDGPPCSSAELFCLALHEPDQYVGVHVGGHFISVHSLDQSMPIMSSGLPTKTFRFFNRASLETGFSGTILRTVPLRTTSTGRPVSMTSSRIR